MAELTNMNESQTIRTRPWAALATFATLAVLSAISFLKYLGWAAFYSGNPTAGEAAGHRAELFFWAFVVLEVLAALVMAWCIRLEGTFSSGAIRLIARYAAGLLVSIVTTGVVVAVLVTIGSRLHR